MNLLFKGFFLFFIIGELVLHNGVPAFALAVLLVLTASNIFRAKYYNFIWMLLFEAILLTVATAFIPDFVILYGVIVYDLVYKRIYVAIPAVVIAAFYFLRQNDLMIFLFLIGLCGLFAFVSQRLAEQKKSFKAVYDRERQQRYELEQTKERLLNSSREIIRLVEIKERNRIAREIHDHIGHKVAGILMQLRASRKLFDKDEKKSSLLLENAIEGLAEALDLLRETVHNVKPRQALGIDYIQDIVDSYSFCPVDFQYTGDFNTLPPNHFEILSSNIKEALTNVAKHSKATQVEISVDVNERYTRLFIKDNGQGCSNLKRGLGLSGMEERIKNVGGSLSVGSKDGFLIVCVIPVNPSGGGNLFENFNRG